MTHKWEPDTQYEAGDVVKYEGHKYKIVQPHRSQSDWAPPLTPALWARLPKGDDSDDEYRGDYPEEKRQDSWDDHKGQSQQVEIPHEEQKKHWYDLEPERKKQLEIGGGLLVGAAAIGAGYLAYKHHEKNEEQKKADIWSLQTWLKDAQQRTEKYHKHGASGPATWILVQGKNIPEEAIKGGHEADEPLYIARFYVDGSIQVGKASTRFEKGALVSYGGQELPEATYEILVGDIRALRWVDVRGKFDPEQLGVTPVEGGREADGTPLYIIQTRYEGTVTPGKASKYTDGALISYGGAEVGVEEYHVLCYH